MEKRSFEYGSYLTKTSDGKTTELKPSDIERKGVEIILNPFFTSLWPQNPTNTSLSPRVPDGPPTASWRSMQMTSPPMTCVALNMW